MKGSQNLQKPDNGFEAEENAIPASQKGRKNIRHIKELEDLKLETKIANRDERERLVRIENYERRLKELQGGEVNENELILDYDFINKKPLICVNQELVQKMKNHQKEGVKFMWSVCYESLEQIKQSKGSGCIIAHCMGLGKTFQVIALVHTLLSNRQIGTKTILICCPKNTLMNWINEFHKWITPELGKINIYNPTRFDDNCGRLAEILKWQTNGGVCVINYELMRILVENEEENGQTKFYTYLCDPGPDLVICDEGHVLKNEDTKLSKAMNKIRTLRRIVLTGTPMQNNLKEYHCMVQFVKPNLLGSRNEFVNMFVNPILNGQYENSRVEDVQLMKERSHILHKKLLVCVQRFDLSTLTSFLPQKQEYVISIPLTESQIQMYEFYMKNYSAKGDPNWKYDGVALFADYQSLQRIWTHPYTLKLYAEKHEEESKKKKKGRKKKKQKRNEDSEDSTDSEDFQWTRVPLRWWLRFVTCDQMEDVRESNKLTILLKILRECEAASEKMLVFSNSLYSLRLIEHFLQKINQSEYEDPCLCQLMSSWEEKLDYLVLTGSTSSEDRDRFCQSFNDPQNSRLRLFLISTKAGGMGINLTAANRAVLFDVSWNPSHDIQSIFRIYRIGQRKQCFVYRFVASGTMEEKIYERQIAKQSISYRVVDEKQIARHYTQRELLELYLSQPKKENKARPMVPKDALLRNVLEAEPERIFAIHEHDSLLEHKEEEELKELEKKDAWTAYTDGDDLKNLPLADKKMISSLTPDSFDPGCFRLALENQYPTATKEDINTMMTGLMPRVKEILQSPNFIEKMKRQALLLHNGSYLQKNKPKTKSESYGGLNVKKRGREKNENFASSDSESSEFVYKLGSKGRKSGSKPTPLKAWGMRGGRSFGSPDFYI